MMKKIKKTNFRFIFVCLTVFLVFNFLPLVLSATISDTVPGSGSTGLVPAGDGGDGPDSYKWPQLVQLVKNVVDFIWRDLMIPLAVIAIVYAGFLVLIGRTKPAELIKAKGTLTKVAIGIFLALGAYTIVSSILSMLKGGDFLKSVMDQVFGTSP